jgi:hypothetical protein
VNGLGHTAGQAASDVLKEFRSEQIFRLEINPAVIQRKQNAVQFPVPETLEQPEARRYSQGLNPERKLESEPQRLRIDY